MPLEHLSGNQARHVFLFNFPRHVREGRLHAYGSPLFPSHAHTLLPTLPLLLTFPPAKMFSSSPLPCFPILFAQNRRLQTSQEILLFIKHSTNQSPNPLSFQIHYFVLNTFSKRGEGVFGGCSDGLRIRKHWCRPDAGSLASHHSLPRLHENPMDIPQ